MATSKLHLLNKVISLCKKRGFIFQTLSSSDGGEERYTYGPLGAELKRNLVKEWWHSVVTSNEFVHPISTPSQRNVEKKKQDSLGVPKTEPTGETWYSDSDRSKELHLKHNLWQGALIHLPDCVKSIGLKVPFGLAETGKVFRKELPSSNYFFLKSREYDSVGLQFFCSPDEHRQWYSQWQKKQLQWWKKFANHPERFGLGEGEENSQLRDMANTNHYVYSTIQFEFPWGSHDLETLTNMGDGFIRRISEQMHHNANVKESLFKVARVRGKKVFPCVISLAGDIDSGLLAYLCDAYIETERTNGLQSLPVLTLHRSLAPYKVAVLPEDSSNEKLLLYCKKLSSELRLAGIATVCSVTGSVEERLQVQNEMGTPYRVLADEGLLESGVVRLQDRDTTIQEEVNGNDVLSMLMKFLSREIV